MVLDHADPSRRLIVREVTLRDIRSYERLEFSLEPGLVLVTGRNGAGKTNLLESLHVGTQGFSPRTRMDAQLIRTGSDRGRIQLRGTAAGVVTDVDVVVSTGESKRVRMNGASLRSAEELRERLSTLVFTPDRLAVVKGGPAVRRAYVDRSLSRLLPARAGVPLAYGAALGQRNALLRRLAHDPSATDALPPWTAQLASHGAELIAGRLASIELLRPGFAEIAADLGLDDATLIYEAEAPTVAALDARLARDVERGATGLGPHLDEIGIRSGSRDLRAFGSQGEQRVAVLALLLAEAELIRDRNAVPPLVLLDDVLSELDLARRQALGERVSTFAQAVVTTTSADALPVDPVQVLAVTPGRVVTAA